jgi:hypothetical protein
MFQWLLDNAVVLGLLIGLLTIFVPLSWTIYAHFVNKAKPKLGVELGVKDIFDVDGKFFPR